MMHADAEVIHIRVLRLPHAEGLDLPGYQSAEAAGMDLVAAVAADEPLLLAPGARALVPTGLMLELPPGTEAQVRPRSGLALRHGITVLNSPGTIDSDYRGELKVLLINLGDAPWEIQRGERMAQLVIQKVERAELIEATVLNSTQRQEGGFGSTDDSPNADGGNNGRARASTHATRAAARRMTLKPPRRP